MEYIFEKFYVNNIKPRFAMEYNVENLSDEYIRVNKIGGRKNG